MSNNYGFRIESTIYSGETCLVSFLDSTTNQTILLGEETIPFDYFPADGTPQGKVFIYFSGTDQTFIIDITQPNPSPTPTSTVTPTPTITVTPTITPTSTVTPTVTVTPSVTSSETPTVTPTTTTTSTVTPTITTTPTITPTSSNSTPTPTPTPTKTPTPTTTPTVTPTNTVTPSSTPVSPVSSGLELYYDPSNLSSYPGSGTTLFDLSSSAVNATIGGSPTYSGNSFTFAGSQSIITGDLSGLFAGWQHSLEIWFNASAIGAVFSDTGTGPTNTSYHATGLEVYSAGPFYLTNAMLWKDVTGGVTRVGGGTVSLNTWYQLVRVYNGSNLAYAYLNKVKSSDTSITWGTPTPGWYLNFGSSETTNFATGAAFQGKIGVVRLYNRVLSLAEVTQNFNAEKSKYGL